MVIKFLMLFTTIIISVFSVSAQPQRVIDTIITFRDLNDLEDKYGQRSEYPFALPTLPLQWNQENYNYLEGDIYTIINVLDKPDHVSRFSISIGMTKYPDAIDELSIAPDGIAWESATSKTKGIYGGGCGAGSCAPLRFRPERHEFVTKFSIKTSPVIFDMNCSRQLFEPMTNLSGLQEFNESGPWKNFLSGVFILLGDENGNIYDPVLNTNNEYGPSATLTAEERQNLFPLTIHITSYMVPKDKLFIPPATWPTNPCDQVVQDPCLD